MRIVRKYIEHGKNNILAYKAFQGFCSIIPQFHLYVFEFDQIYGIFIPKELETGSEMPPNGVSKAVQEFIFEYIDSIDQLEVLLLMRATRERSWTAKEISDAMRTSLEAATHRLSALVAIGLLTEQDANPPTYRYSPLTVEMDGTVEELAETYKVHRHSIYGLIFSTLKRARRFLDAFTMIDEKDENNDE